MDTVIEKPLLKKSPCNECRKRKRKCSYEQPCERCERLNRECSYTITASPIDVEYMQEVEYAKQVEELESQISIMEKEINAIKLTNEKNVQEDTKEACKVTTIEDKEGAEQQQQQVEQSQINEPEQLHQQKRQKVRSNQSTDYPSPISMNYGITPSLTFTTHSIDPYFVFNHQHNENYQHHHHDFRYSPYFFENTDQSYLKQQRKQRQTCKDQNQLVATSGKFNVYVTPQKEQESWILSVNKGGDLTINTCITSHTELLIQLKNILNNVDEAFKKPTVPMVMPDYSPNTYVTSTLNSMLWISYGKQRIKNVTKTFHLDYKIGVASVILPFETLAVVAMKIVKVYLNCTHLSHFYLYAPYFLRHFMKADYQELLNSPAVMALCSSICLLPCKHISSLIPFHAFWEYAAYYFEQARELISERFDEISLESVTTYTFMALYKLEIKEYDECLKYVGIAIRIYSTLQPLYLNDQASEEALFFQRINRCIRFVNDSALVNEMFAVGGLSKYAGRHNFHDTLKGNDITPVLEYEQDSPQEKEFILLHRLKSKLQKKLHHLILNFPPRSSALPSCVGEISHQTEMTLRHWYRHILPEKFQLSLPLFEDSISDLDFFSMLEKECHGNQVSLKLLSLIYVYNEYLVMAKAYLPKDPIAHLPTVDELMERVKEIGEKNKFNDPLPPPRMALRWEKLLYRLVHFNRYHTRPDLNFSEKEEQYVRELLESIQLEDMNFNMPVAFISIVTAFNMVRLTQFLITKEYVCFLDYKWLVNAWKVFMRASRFHYNSDENGITLERIKANMLVCMKIMKQHPIYEKSSGIDDVLVEMEEEYNECIA